MARKRTSQDRRGTKLRPIDLTVRAGDEEARIGEVKLPNLTAVLERSLTKSGAGAKRAKRRPGGKRTTVTVPEHLNRMVEEISRQIQMAHNEVLLALATHAADLVEEEVERARIIARRRHAALEDWKQLPAQDEFPSDEEIDAMLAEARAE